MTALQIDQEFNFEQLNLRYLFGIQEQKRSVKLIYESAVQQIGLLWSNAFGSHCCKDI
jgi:hypothetical protein